MYGGPIRLRWACWGTDGDFYGTTERGGPEGYRTIFKITSSGTLTTLFTFNFTDGSTPPRGWYRPPMRLLRDDVGGQGQHHLRWRLRDCLKITPGGTLTTLYNFCSEGHCRDGSGTSSGLVQAADGDLYGVTP